MGASVSRAALLGDASLPAASATDAFAFSWQPLSGGVLIGAEVGGISIGSTSKFSFWDSVL
jgi:hypothetical protein